MRFAGFLCSLVCVTACFVDETGYNTPPASGFEDSTTEVGVDVAAEPTVTLADDVIVTSERPIGELPTVVHIIGLEGSVDARAVVEMVTADEAVFDGVVMGTGFVVSVDGVAGDVLSLVVDDVDMGLVLLEGVDTAGIEPGDVSTEGAEVALMWDVADEDVWVGDGALEMWSAPYVVYNTTSGASVLVLEGDTEARIVASAGDELCISSLTNEESSATSRCASVP
jgi:hypothetical protein